MPPKKTKAKQSSSSLPSYQFPSKFTQLPSQLTSSFYKPSPESILPRQIIVIDNFFSHELCNELIRSFTTSLTLETTPLIKSKEYAARFNDRASVTDPDAASCLWTYLQGLLTAKTEYEDEDLDDIRSIFDSAQGLNPQLRIYRYLKGHHFGQHYDESVSVTIPQSKQRAVTKWTLLIYLTGDEEFKGGDTIFYPEFERNSNPINVHPTKGMALLHKHGDDCLKHEAGLVKEGEKWVLRSDVYYSR